MSFTKASDELNVSRVAVSQQIKALEAYLGSPTVSPPPSRTCNSLTHLGERYHRTVSGPRTDRSLDSRALRELESEDCDYYYDNRICYILADTKHRFF